MLCRWRADHHNPARFRAQLPDRQKPARLAYPKTIPWYSSRGGRFPNFAWIRTGRTWRRPEKIGEMGARAFRFVDAPEKYELGTAPLQSRRRCIPPYDARRVPSNNQTSCPLFGSSDHPHISTSYRISDKHRLGLQPRALQEL